jgi:hypothetical protein
MASIATVSASPVLTEAQAKILNTVKAVAGNTGGAIKRTTAEVADSVRVNLPALELAAGSAKATGDLGGARFVAGKTKELADSLRAAIKNSDSLGPLSPQAPSPEQINTIAKQLKLLLVKARIALLNPNAQASGAGSQRAAETAVQTGEAALKALENQIKAASKSTVDISA